MGEMLVSGPNLAGDFSVTNSLSALLLLTNQSQPLYWKMYSLVLSMSRCLNIIPSSAVSSAVTSARKLRPITVPIGFTISARKDCQETHGQAHSYRSSVLMTSNKSTQPSGRFSRSRLGRLIKTFSQHQWRSYGQKTIFLLKSSFICCIHYSL